MSDSRARTSVLVAVTSALLIGGAASALGGGGAPVTSATPAPAANCRSIADLVASDPNFSTLGTALNAAGLTNTFRGAGPFTVFAPTNAAFAKLPAGTLTALVNNKAALTSVLQYHVVRGRVTAAQAARLDSATTLGGELLTISRPGTMLMVNDATVTRADVTACNGIVHVIDTVLVPPNVDVTTLTGAAPAATTQSSTTSTTSTASSTTTAQTGTPGITAAQIPARPITPATSTTTTQSTTGTTSGAASGTTTTTDTQAGAGTTGTATGTAATTTTTATTSTTTIAQIVATDPRFSTLLAALNAAGLVETLNGAGPFTVFAPTNDAFAKIPAADLQALLADKAALTRVLTYHVVAGAQTAAQVTASPTLTTVAGPTVAVTVDGSTVKVGGATVTQADVTASNGVIHVIDTVLMPPAQ
ncbi:fasciclin domain-containing protein [Deinococcus pimensis]|uniref:fasciclin domain-containing protein n=1 Tax=Deinococcus pimensis TaxID=309888 RepID=UPI0004BCC7FD|nr:fasciclin domain-containing protein [Deinococcus pimensis]